MKIVLIVLSAAMMISCICDPEDREPRNRDNVVIKKDSLQ